MRPPSSVAIGEWVANASETVLSMLGAGASVRCESTIRRAVQRICGDHSTAHLVTHLNCPGRTLWWIPSVS
jgi:hypothetical protein